MKKSDVLIVLQALNGSHKSLDFTVDTFEEKESTFLGLLIEEILQTHFIKIPILVNIPIMTDLC